MAGICVPLRSRTAAASLRSSVVQGAAVNLLKLDGKFSEKHEHKAMVTVVIEGDDAGLL